MPHLAYTRRAIADIQRCRRFLLAKNPVAALRAAKAIDERVNSLVFGPEIGRPVTEDNSMRELVVPFGDGGYVVLYRHVAATDTVYVLAVRHQKEAGY